MVHRWRRMTAFIALLSILGLLIAACGNTGGGTGTGATAGAGGAGGGTAAETVTAAGGDAGGDATITTAETATMDASGGTTAETATAGGAATETATAGEMMTETATAGGETATAGGETATAGGETATAGGETATAGAAATDTATAGAAGAGTTSTADAASMEQTRTAGNATGATATTGAAAAGAAPAPAAALPANCTNVQLQYWTPFTGPDGPFMQSLVDKFNSAQQNVQVNHTIQSEYNTQLGTAAASGTLPDVAVINEDQVATQAFRNVLRPMDTAVQAGGITAGDFPQVAWQAGQVAGKTYGVPLSFVAMTMYVNQDLLTKAGLSAPPKNDAEFQRAAQAMTQGDAKGFMLTTGFPVQQIFQMLLHQYGGTEFSQDFSQATWNSDAGVKALTWMKDAQTKYSDPNLEVDAELNAFKAGGAGMIWNGIWQIPNVTGEGVEFKSQAAPVPQIGPNPAVWAGGPLLTLPVQQGTVDPCKDAAAGVFVRYLIDNSVEWAKAGNIPASNRARNSAEFKALPHAVIGASVENPVFPPPVPGIGDAFTPLSEAVSAVMSGSATDIKAALDDAANRANQVLTENKTNYGAAPKGQ